MTDEIMTALGMGGNEYLKPTVTEYINEVKEYLKDAGVKESVINSAESVGTIARGVADLWTYAGGEGKLSPYFYERATQLSLR